MAKEAGRRLLAPTFHSGTGTVVDLCANPAGNGRSGNVDFRDVGLRRALVDHVRCEAEIAVRKSRVLGEF